MKKTLFIALLLGGCADVSQAPEPKIPTQIEGLELKFIETDIDGAMISINFLNESVGFISGHDGSIYKTTDAAENWRKVSTDTSLPINSMFFVTREKGWAVGGENGCSGNNCTPRPPVILKTTDSGETWNSISLNLSKAVELNSVWFVNNDLGFAVGFDMILRTTNGGDTWTESILHDLPGIMKSVRFFDDKNGLITGTRGISIRTNDGGDNWYVSSPFPDSGVNSLTLTNNIAFSAGYETLHRSTDFGATWNELPAIVQDPYPHTNSLNFVSGTRGFALGSGYWSGGDFGHNTASIFYTDDGGSTWKGSIDVHEIEEISSSSFPTPDVGYGLSLYGNIVKITVN